MKIVSSGSSARRLAAATAWLDALDAPELVVVGATRRAADDFVRARARATGGVLGISRRTLAMFARELATEGLAAAGRAPVTGLGAQAVAARAVFNTVRTAPLSYFAPVADKPGFARALARTIGELRRDLVGPDALESTGPSGPDLARLYRQYLVELERAHVADAAMVFALASDAIALGRHRLVGLPIVALDVPVQDAASARLLGALSSSAPAFLATVTAGDDVSRAHLEAIARDISDGKTVNLDAAITPADGLERVRQRVFSVDAVEPAPTDDTIELFSAANEAREAVEVARRVRALAKAGVAHDQVAIVLRDPHAYQPLVEDALRRADVPAFYSVGSRRPNPAGRAFIALLDCAAEGLSATRFAEYLSLGQVPKLDELGAPPKVASPWVAPAGEAQLVFFTETAPADDPEVAPVSTDVDDAPEVDTEDSEDDAKAIAGTLLVPRRWERMLVDAAVIGGKDRWARRLGGLERELHLQVEGMEDDDPRRVHRQRDLQRLQNLQQFALPVVEALDGLPEEAHWKVWLDALSALASMTLRRPDGVASVLAELAPMGSVGPVGLSEVREVLADRLTTLRAEPQKRRFGRVFVSTIAEVGGRAFDTVFVPGLAEGIFPRKAKEDPLLLDAHRDLLAGSPLADQTRRFADERLLLRTAASAATHRLVASYPRTDTARGRPRVPSFYALDLIRAAEGEIPKLRAFEKRATAATSSRLGWPAPVDPKVAIDAAEYDLSFLADLLQKPTDQTKGHAHYLIEASQPLARSLRARLTRWSVKWSRADGLMKPSPGATEVLAEQSLKARSYSPTALQHYSHCPYRFYLQAILRLRQRDEAVALERMDPLTRGGLFHLVQERLLRHLRDHGHLPIVEANQAEVIAMGDKMLTDIAREQEDALAPAIERVWNDAVEALRGDLHGWIRDLVKHPDEYEPKYFEFAFGLSRRDGTARDAATIERPAKVLDGYLLRGSIDLVERSRVFGTLRVTDHKTGRATKVGNAFYVGGGRQLQPVLYALAAKDCFKDEVVAGQLYFCTERGGYTRLGVDINKTAREAAETVLKTIDKSVKEGCLPAAPDKGACKWCDYRLVCGPGEERRTGRKRRDLLDDLVTLRRLP